MDAHEIEQIETDLLLEGIFRRYGYDFRAYARASVDRRVQHFRRKQRLGRVSELIPLCLHDSDLFAALAREFSISVTEMFRDPHVFRAVREHVAPLLKTFPFARVWHAGCATGEEVYSLAIVLQECGALERATIFGTDFNDDALEQAREGIYSAERIQDYTRNHQEAGGTGSFSEYYHARYGSAVISPALRERITFANHNLATDTVFGEMHLVFCRNVLIYFNQELQDRALGLFTDSLVRGGFLCLGTRETLRFSAVADQFEVVDQKARIYKKRARP